MISTHLKRNCSDNSKKMDMKVNVIQQAQKAIEKNMSILK